MSSRQQSSVIDSSASGLLPEMLPDDVDLAAVNEAWRTLPEGVRQSILMLVKAAKG